MQGNVLGQSGGGLKIDELIEEYKVASGGNVSVGDFVKFVEEYNIGTDTQLNTVLYSGEIVSAVALSSTKVFIAHSYGASYSLAGTICTIDENTIIAGTHVILGVMYTAKNISAVALSSNKVFIAYNYCHPNNSDSQLYGIVCTVNGTTITAGTATQLDSNYFTNHTISAVTLTSTKVFIVHTTARYYGIGVKVCTVSGTTITISIDKQISNTAHTGDVISAVALSSNKVFIAHNYSGDNDYYYLHGIVCLIDENSINEEVDPNALIYNTTNVARVISVERLLDSKVFIVHSHGDNQYLYGLVCTIDGTTIIRGIDTQLSSVAKSGANLSTTLIENNKVLITHSYTNYSNLYGIVCTVNGTTITARTDTQIVIQVHYTSSTISAVALTLNKVFIAHRNNSSSYLFGISIQLNNFIKQLESSTDPILGISNTSGTENEVVQVYVPNV